MICRVKTITVLTVSALLASCSGIEDKTTDAELKSESVRLKGTKWNSQFYYYNNFYHFETDSTGFSDDGQVAWSCPIDLKKENIPENKILYSGVQKFSYKIKTDTLIIDYGNAEKEGSNLRVFIYRKTYKDWISEEAYAYGNEVLKPGERAFFFEEMKL